MHRPDGVQSLEHQQIQGSLQYFRFRQRHGSLL
jgi:hypothetical protein